MVHLGNSGVLKLEPSEGKRIKIKSLMVFVSTLTIGDGTITHTVPAGFDMKHCMTFAKGATVTITNGATTTSVIEHTQE